MEEDEDMFLSSLGVIFVNFVDIEQMIFDEVLCFIFVIYEVLEFIFYSIYFCQVIKKFDNDESVEEWLEGSNLFFLSQSEFLNKLRVVKFEIDVVVLIVE